MKPLGQRQVLFTNRTGFLRVHLCDRLLAEGHEFFRVESNYTGRRANIGHLRSARRLMQFSPSIDDRGTMELSLAVNAPRALP